MKKNLITLLLSGCLFILICGCSNSNHTDTNSTLESSSSFKNETEQLLEFGKYNVPVEITGEKRDASSIVKNKEKFLFPKCTILSVTYSTFSEDTSLLSLNSDEVLQFIHLIENSSILKDGDSLSNYGVDDNTPEYYVNIGIVYKTSSGALQNVSLNTFKGNILHFYDTSGEDYRIGPNEELVKFITKHAGYRVLSATDFDKIKRITVKYDEEEYDLSDNATKKFVKALRKLDKRQDEFHDSNLTAIAYTSDGDMYHIKAAAGKYSENDIAIEGACYSNAKNLIYLLENQK